MESVLCRQRTEKMPIIDSTGSQSTAAESAESEKYPILSRVNGKSHHELLFVEFPLIFRAGQYCGGEEVHRNSSVPFPCTFVESLSAEVGVYFFTGFGQPSALHEKGRRNIHAPGSPVIRLSCP
jgi:hypothetical protein